MIKEIFNVEDQAKSYGLSAIKFAAELFLESENNSDPSFLDIKENLPEIDNIYKDEEKLRDYFRTSQIWREVKDFFVHCAATQPTATVASILNYWKNVLKWKNVGYHILIGPDFYTVLSNPNNVTNGVQGYNSNGFHVSYIGGIDKKGNPQDTRTDYQKKMIAICLEEGRKKFPKARVRGHNEVKNKACPSFLVREQYPLYWRNQI